MRNLDQELIKSNLYNDEQQDDIPTSIFRKAFACSFKKEKIRGNQAKFMTKELRRAFMDRSKFKNEYLKWPSRENLLHITR